MSIPFFKCLTWHLGISRCRDHIGVDGAIRSDRLAAFHGGCRLSNFRERVQWRSADRPEFTPSQPASFQRSTSRPWVTHQHNQPLTLAGQRFDRRTSFPGNGHLAVILPDNAE